ncbi:MAG: response regulator transcription factor [Armatimonadota bacterium]|nr:response regulator transcription factor [bacterium]
MNNKILLIEDQAPIAESVADFLTSEGFKVETTGDGLSGLSVFRAFSPDLIVLDLMLPKLNGLDFCRIVRKESNVPIVMLTAKTEEIDRIIGLEFGADDYVPKPFSIHELTTRVKAVLCRAGNAREDDQNVILEVGDVQLDLARRRVTIRGEQVYLPLKQFELLRALMSNKGRVLSREELFKRVWDADAAYDTGSLDVHIRWLRKKIEPDPSHPTYIRTVRGVGYRIVGDNDD